MGSPESSGGAVTPSHKSNSLPRAICPRCGRDVALRNRGELREHKELPPAREPRARICAAAGWTVEAWKEAHQG